ncbi:MAG TPA: hypothetical protein VFG74_10940, partial [Miltoncostaeaceae bacterium]|nr:hypothetical protein [Miltoncostaeaceae bacterium]
MRGLTRSTHERLLRRHAGAVRLVCALALGDAHAAGEAADDALRMAVSAIPPSTRPGDRLPRLLALAVFACDGRGAAPGRDDPWAPVRDLPPAERTALLLHEGAGLSVRRTARGVGMPWREASDLIFAARRTLARPGDDWEPLECTAHRRRLSDAGCPDAAPQGSREHLAGCDGCRGMVDAAAARRAAAAAAAVDVAVAPIPPAGTGAQAPGAPRRPVRGRALRRPVIVGAAVAVLLALAVGGAVALVGGGPGQPEQVAQVASADPVAAGLALTPSSRRPALDPGAERRAAVDRADARTAANARAKAKAKAKAR